MIRKQLLDFARENGGVVTAAQARSMGAPSILLTRLTRENVLRRVSRGVYALGSADADPWFILQARSPVCVFSHVSALFLLGETDDVPGHAEVTVYAGYNASHLPQGTAVHYVRRELLGLGETVVRTRLGNAVRCYDLERTVCDMIAARARTDTELFARTMQNYARDPRADLRRLMRYARRMGLEARVRGVLEVLL
jgi:predicted transcriptional regulator of viral defense system